MKKTTTKRMLCLLSVLLLACSLLLTGCKSEPLVIKDSDTFIVLKVTQKDLESLEGENLIDYMDALAEGGQLACTIEDGMITSINGIYNPADFSSCWMLYTSDPDNSSQAWGSVEYEGVEYGSAISGAEVLKLKVDTVYIWVFQSF